MTSVIFMLSTVLFLSGSAAMVDIGVGMFLAAALFWGRDFARNISRQRRVNP
jgi:hypothetical protein